VLCHEKNKKLFLSYARRVVVLRLAMTSYARICTCHSTVWFVSCGLCGCVVVCLCGLCGFGLWLWLVVVVVCGFGLWFVVCGFGFVVCGLWFVGCGLWLWFVGCGVCCGLWLCGCVVCGVTDVYVMVLVVRVNHVILCVICVERVNAFP
jgi:hypothetical protein